MAFDLDKFEKTEFTERTVDVSVPELSCFFPPGEDPVWHLRCVDASEMFFAREQAMDSGRQKADIIEGLLSGVVPDDLIKELKYKAGLGAQADDVHREVVLRRVLLKYGSVPRCPEHIALKLSTHYGEAFKRITDKLLELYSMGNIPGELPGSGGSQE